MNDADRNARVLAVMLCLTATVLWAEGQAAKVDYVLGEATAVDSTTRQLTLKTDAGTELQVQVPEDARVVRAKPGAKDLAEARPLTLGEIAVGDRIMVRAAAPPAGGTALRARQVVVMNRDDVAHQHEEERGEWRRRGLVGVVTAVDAAKGEITLQTGRRPGAPSTVVATAGRAVVFRRYAPDSVKFGDAQASALTAVQVGDELRALGQRTEAGPFEAEQVVFGSFRLVSGSVTSVDAVKGELVVRDEESRRNLTVAVGPDARLRRLPAELAERLSRPRDPGAPGAGAGWRGAGGGGSAGDRPRWNREGGSGPEDFVERLPATTLGELKVGDRVLVSSTKGNDASRLTAIALVSGLEALQPPSRGPMGRTADPGLPPELMDLGMSVQ
jgi:hypothetical protein